MPASFVDQQVQFVATVSRAGRRTSPASGSSTADLRGLLPAHLGRIRHGLLDRWGCTPARRPPRRPRPRWPSGRRSPRWRRRRPRAEAAGVRMLPVIRVLSSRRREVGSLPRARSRLPSTRTGAYLLVRDHQCGRRRRTAEAAPVVTEVVAAGGREGDPGGHHGGGAPAPGRASTPRYGVWMPEQATVFPPLAPAASDVLNPRRTSRHGRRRPTSAGTLQRLSRGAAPPPHHGGGPRARRHRPPRGRGRRLLAAARDRLPAHGAPPGGGPSTGHVASTTCYESAATFDEVYAAIVEELVAAASDAAPVPVVYAVTGSPWWPSAASSCSGRRPGRR